MAVVMDPQMPTGTEVASYQTYAQARTAVDFLSDSGFDVSSITIVGTDLHLVERVTGRMTIARASMSGASSGALWGALAGMLMSAGQNAGGTGAWVVGGIVVGALAGMALSALAFLIRGRSRDLVCSALRGPGLDRHRPRLSDPAAHPRQSGARRTPAHRGTAPEEGFRRLLPRWSSSFWCGDEGRRGPGRNGRQRVRGGALDDASGRGAGCRRARECRGSERAPGPRSHHCERARERGART